MQMTQGETNPVTTEITEMAKRLRLPHLRRNFQDLCTTAKAQRWDPIELVRVLLETEIDGRNASTLLVRRAAANLPGNRTLAGFDHSVSSVPTHVINALGTLEWIKRAENLIVCGPPGTGKSFLAEALASEAIEAGMRVSWFNSESLARTIATAKATDTLGPILAKFQRLDLVVIDDLGILPIGENDSEALYRVVEACYETTSLIVTSNFVLASFDEILNPRSIAAALVDRLAHHAHLIETTGESIRLSQALSGKGVMPL